MNPSHRRSEEEEEEGGGAVTVDLTTPLEASSSWCPGDWGKEVKSLIFPKSSHTIGTQLFFIQCTIGKQVVHSCFIT